MKYLPLVWAALRRKPIRTGATFLSVIVAFTLFGLMIGLDSTLERLEAVARADRAWTNMRFDTVNMPVSVGKRIASLPGIKKISIMAYLSGYVGDPKNNLGIVFVDDAYGELFPDQAPKEQWELLRRNPDIVIMNRLEAGLLHKKVGDRFVLISARTARADGSHNWPLTVGGIYDDLPNLPGGQIWGNYKYLDRALPLAEQGKINEADFITKNPAQTAALAEQIDALFANSANPTRTMTEKQIYAVNGNGGGIDIEALTRKIAIIGLLMILLLTANVIAQSVRERGAEFAALKTFGFSDAGLAGLVMAEAALPCLLGAGLGVTLAGYLAPKLPLLMPPGTGIPTPDMSAAVYLWAQGAALLLVVASTVLPVWRLARLDVATALSRRA